MRHDDAISLKTAEGARRGTLAAVGSLLTAALLLAPGSGLAEDIDQADLAQKIQNPLADLISVPFQNNWDFGIGPENATRYTLNVQPIIPISLDEKWLLVVRTIVPVIHAEAPARGLDSHSGMGDIVQSFFLAPRSDPGTLGWGLGPVFLWPTATEDALGAGKWGMGPTAVAVIQEHGWTGGMLANHIWSYAGTGNEDRDDVSASMLQPFVSYLVKKTYTTFAVTSETVYDWEASDWTIPVNLTVSQMLKIGKLPIQVAAGPRVYVERPSNGPDWGLRCTVNFLLPGI